MQAPASKETATAGTYLLGDQPTEFDGRLTIATAEPLEIRMRPSALGAGSAGVSKVCRQVLYGQMRLFRYTMLMRRFVMSRIAATKP